MMMVIKSVVSTLLCEAVGVAHAELAPGAVYGMSLPNDWVSGSLGLCGSRHGTIQRRFNTTGISHHPFGALIAKLHRIIYSVEPRLELVRVRIIKLLCVFDDNIHTLWDALKNV